jgi:hypothetical protein
MTVHDDHYYSVGCNARIDNLLTPQCPARSAGGFHDSDSVLKSALVAGWTEIRGKHFCPAHSATVTEADAEPVKPARQRKSSRPETVDPTPEGNPG